MGNKLEASWDAVGVKVVDGIAHIPVVSLQQQVDDGQRLQDEVLERLASVHELEILWHFALQGSEGESHTQFIV